jgi:hypothetical protein
MQALMPDSSAGASGGPDPIREILTGLAIVLLFYVGMGMAEYIYKTFNSLWQKRVELFPETYTAGTKMFTALQNPSNPKSQTVYFSDNERSGVEFSYSLFVNISSATFANGDKKLYHIMHKGYSQPYPLLGPGIFCWGHKNAIRVYMNSYNSWDNYTEVDNIPVDKWFHLVVSCKGNVLYVYINGSLKQKMTHSKSTPPYQNYGNVYLFNTRKLSLTSTNTVSLTTDPDFISSEDNNNSPLTSLDFNGTAMGMASSVYYFSYALSYSEINSLMNVGPSPVMAPNNQQSMSPYLADSWWANNNYISKITN